MKSTALLQPLRTSRSFRALWSGQLLSGFGDEAFAVILPMVVYALTRSPWTMGLLLMLRVIPQIVIQPFSGVLVDRLSRVSLMMASDTVRFVLLLYLAFLGLRHHLSIGELDIIVVAYGTMSVVFRPAYMALRKQVFTPDIRTAAISLTQVGSQVTMTVGPSVGGLMLAVASSAAGFLFDAATFAGSVVSLIVLRRSDSSLQTKPVASTDQSFLADLVAGYRESLRHPWVWVGIVAWNFIIIAYAGITPILLPWLFAVHFHYSAFAYGLAVSMAGVGAVVAGGVAGTVRTWKRRGILAYTGVGVQGLALLGVSFIHWFPGLVVMMALSAAGSMLFGIIHEGVLQELIPDEFYGRVISFEVLCASIAQPLGYLLTGSLSRSIGGILAMRLEAGTMVVVVALTLLVPSIRKFQ